jgi:hypothetical protein
MESVPYPPGGGVDICQRHARKAQPIELWGFLADAAPAQIASITPNGHAPCMKPWIEARTHAPEHGGNAAGRDSNRPAAFFRFAGAQFVCCKKSFLISETGASGGNVGKSVSPRFGSRLYWPSIVVAFAVGIALVLAAEPFLPQPASLPTVTQLQTTTPWIPQKFEIVDGDTVDFQSTRYRLVGFNTPESGMNAQCAAERAMAAKASQRSGAGAPSAASSRRVRYTGAACRQRLTSRQA